MPQYSVYSTWYHLLEKLCEQIPLNVFSLTDCFVGVHFQQGRRLPRQTKKNKFT